MLERHRFGLGRTSYLLAVNQGEEKESDDFSGMGEGNGANLNKRMCVQRRSKRRTIREFADKSA